ncbi:MAG: DUF4918 family protein [Bacteroidota bacterium]|nr:DUF4918 family protein [Bacteroidota bacterium]
MKTFAEKVIAFNRQLSFSGKLPQGIRIMNPFTENMDIHRLSSLFYNKYYSDQKSRSLILGINPGRFGAGITGIPFTDPKRLIEKCNIPFDGPPAHEPSSVFIYEMIESFGGSDAFYEKFYINSVCPLGFTQTGKNGKETNYNYYDSKELTGAVYRFIIENIKKQIALGIERHTCFCFGTGKNEKFLRQLNAENGFFKEIVALEHPRFIMQYKSKSKQVYLDKYLSAFRSVL